MAGTWPAKGGGPGHKKRPLRKGPCLFPSFTGVCLLRGFVLYGRRPRPSLWLPPRRPLDWLLPRSDLDGLLAAAAGRLSGARLCGGRLAGLDCLGGGEGLNSRLLECASERACPPRGRLLATGSGRLVRTACLGPGRLTDWPRFEGRDGSLTLRRGFADRTTRLPRDLSCTTGSRFRLREN